MKQFILGLIAMKVGGDLWHSVRRKLKYRKMDREIAAYYANGGAFVSGWEGWVEDALAPTQALMELMQEDAPEPNEALTDAAARYLSLSCATGRTDSSAPNQANTPKGKPHKWNCSCCHNGISGY